ncbi:uncharacterized protein LOC106160899 [Lingula anatina]|uniref:Uncharacterized protein LOC106160899 n=1 Tax=Lingula anatina TaxID=7574 RepID=A0A1S3I4D5_LINAN|nr:uncharacterized protein LOC106160899 [Lingula anatina]XP_013393135.1 uncharacterized protein LOC106160899 [Lingula anatina]|eukprot:XP_013393127.1 uncharacterized protein LOC106160899 [Lingula anatina]
MSTVKTADLTELKSLAAPPQDVKSILHAVVLLLGYPEKLASNWKFVRKVMVHKGEQGMMHGMEHFDAKKVSKVSAVKARALLDSLNVERVKQVSRASVSFLLWAKSHLEEVEAAVI